MGGPDGTFDIWESARRTRVNSMRDRCLVHPLNANAPAIVDAMPEIEHDKPAVCISVEALD